MFKYKISIIIPCIPRDIKYLNKLILSINQQTYFPYEIIIAFSGINNQEKDIIENELKKISKFLLIIITVPEIKFASENRNRGGKIAKGNLLSFMDADDTMHPKKLEITNLIFNKFKIKFLIHSYNKNLNNHIILNKYFNLEFGDIIYDKAYKINNTINNNLLISKPWYIDRFKYHHGHITIPKHVFKKIKYREGTNFKRGQDAVLIRDILSKYGRNKYTGLFIDLPLTNYIPASHK